MVWQEGVHWVWEFCALCGGKLHGAPDSEESSDGESHDERHDAAPGGEPPPGDTGGGPPSGPRRFKRRKMN